MDHTSLPGEGHWKVATTVVHAVAIVVTVYRVYHRKRTCGLWWDDYFALFALGMDIVSLVFSWTNSRIDLIHNVNTRVAIAWLQEFLFTFIIWPARISLTLSVSRILTPAEPLFKYTILVTLFFGLLMTGSILQVAVHCAQDTSWYQSSPIQCTLLKSTPIFFVTSDVTADLVLVIMPLCIFWHVHLPTVEKYVILGGFTASLLTTIACVVAAVLLLGGRFHGVVNFLLSQQLVQLLATTSLIACNFLVIITRSYNLCQQVRRHLPWRKLGKGPTSTPQSDIILTELSNLQSFDSSLPESERRPLPVTNLVSGSTETPPPETRIAHV